MDSVMLVPFCVTVSLNSNKIMTLSRALETFPAMIRQKSTNTSTPPAVYTYSVSELRALCQNRLSVACTREECNTRWTYFQGLFKSEQMSHQRRNENNFRISGQRGGECPRSGLTRQSRNPRPWTDGAKLKYFASTSVRPKYFAFCSHSSRSVGST